MFSHVTRRGESRGWLLRGAVVLAVGGALAVAIPEVTLPVTRPAAARVQCVNNTAQDTATLTNAVSRGGTVNIGAGTCALSGRIPVRRSVVIDGAGAQATFLVQHASSNIFQIVAAGVTVENLNLDTRTFNNTPPVRKSPNPAVLFSNASNTSIINVDAEAGSGFGLRVTGPNPCETYQTTGTVVRNLNVLTSGVGGFAALDIDCTNGATLSNITIHGGILALFMDENVALTNEDYHGDNPSFKCQPAWFITGPSHNIAIGNVTSSAGPGRITGSNPGITVTNQKAAC
jgi:hypothetical protein